MKVRNMSAMKLLENYFFQLGARKKKEIYYIEINLNVCGFFALLRNTVNACCYAEENGFYPYVKYGKDVLYAEKGVFLGTNNPYEYYFEQPKIIKNFTDLGKINVIRMKGMHLDSIELKYNRILSTYQVKEEYINRMAEIYKKYIRLNQRTQGIIDQNIQRLLKGKKTLGVHIRGTDFYKQFNRHPVPVTVDEYAEVIRRESSQGQYAQVFVATDDMGCLKELQRKLSVPLVYYKNTMRGEGNKSVAFQQNERKFHHYLLGMEILRDAYTLAACEGFTGCLSQVDFFVRIIKASKGQKFDFINIIDNGVNKNNRECWEPQN